MSKSVTDKVPMDMPTSGSLSSLKNDQPSKMKTYGTLALGVLAKMVLMAGAAVILTSALNTRSPSVDMEALTLHIIAGAGAVVLGVALLGLVEHLNKKKKDDKKVAEGQTEAKLWERIKPKVLNFAHHLIALAIIGGIVAILTSQWDLQHGADITDTMNVGIAATTVGGMSLIIRGLFTYWARKEKQAEAKFEASNSQ